MDYMYDGCTLIKMSETQDSEYTNEYSIYTDGKLANGMFNNTSGTFTGEVIGSPKTLYTSNTVID